MHSHKPPPREIRVRLKEGPDQRSVTLQQQERSQKQRSHLFVVLWGWTNSLWVTRTLTPVVRTEWPLPGPYDCTTNQPCYCWAGQEIWAINLHGQVLRPPSTALQRAKQPHAAKALLSAKHMWVPQPLHQGRVQSYKHVTHDLKSLG